MPSTAPWPDALTASVNESAMGEPTIDLRLLPPRRGPPIPRSVRIDDTTERFVRPSKGLLWSSVVDHMGVDQAIGILSGHTRGELPDARVFMW